MARLKLPAFNEGSLLRRTLLYVSTFVLGSVTFVSIATLLVVTVAKSLLPRHGAEDTASVSAEVGAPGKSGTAKLPPHVKRPKGTDEAADSR